MKFFPAIGHLARTVMMACAAVLLAAVLATAGPRPALATAMAAPAGQTCANPGENLRGALWTQQLLGLDRAWPFTRGDGVTVAVLSSGVDANQPQLRGRVNPGLDAVTGTGPAQDDCLGIGTQVAGVIAGRSLNGFAGVAPNATILPIRVAAAATSGVLVAQPEVLARGINAAVQQGANVIAVATVTYTDTVELRDSVTNALAKDVTVIAAVGDLGDAGGANPGPYPAKYAGVIGVGAVDQAGQRWTKSQHGSYVDLVAPGVAVTTLQRGQGLVVVDGTGLACGFVAGAAALVRARRGSTATTKDISQALFATAIPSAGGQNFGHGIVNPYAAISEQVARATPAALPALARPTAAASSDWARSRTVAVTGTAIALLAVLGVGLAALTLPRGRRRFWRSALAPAPRVDPEPDEPGPPIQLFDERRARDDHPVR